jgi:hypothetical protein
MLSPLQAHLRTLYQAQDALVQSDRMISANLISLYKSLGGGWETIEESGRISRRAARAARLIEKVVAPAARSGIISPPVDRSVAQPG